MASTEACVQRLHQIIRKRDPDQVEFHQAVFEVLDTLAPVFQREPKYIDVMERLLEPERQIMFRVPWTDDQGKQQVNRGYRVQMSSSLGPYKGGLRFHPSVNLSIIKFLAFEQTFKNSLTGLMMGSGKGGADFDPRGRSDNEIMHFCQSFMTELYRHIGEDTDVPAGDINVSTREIGYLFGQYKRITGQFTGIISGKDLKWGGSLIRTEATGYGCVYFASNYLKFIGKSLKDKRCLISGSGNVAQYTAEKLVQMGAIPITFSDSNGYVLEPKGFSLEQVKRVIHLKSIKHGRISEYCELSSTAQYFPGKKPWEVPADLAFPSATQNEIEEYDAKMMVSNGVIGVFEGANMPSTSEAINVFKNKHIMFAPGKASNAGGVAVSGLEMAQNSQRLAWSREEVDEKLEQIMKNIFESCVASAKEYDLGDDIQAGANIAGFLKVADAMVDQGCV